MSELEVVRDDGGRRPVDEDALRELKAFADEIRADCSEEVFFRRQVNENARYCRWAGQSDDGRKRKDSLGFDPKPFEGASDARVRLADQIINEQAAEIVTAAMRAVPRVMGMEGTDGRSAGKVETLLKWLIRNQWGSKFRRTVELLAQYMLGDSPGGAVMGVVWRSERALQPKRVTRDMLLDEYANALAGLGVEITEDGLAAAAAIMEDPRRREEVKDIIRAMLPHLKERRVSELARRLNEDGEAVIPVPYVKPGLPELGAYRLFEDVFFPSNTTDLQAARCIIVREWMTKAQVMERAGTDGWRDEFVRALVGDENHKGKEGQTAFGFDEAESVSSSISNPAKRDGLYEVLTSFVRTANEDGIPGIQIYKWNYYCDQAAKDRELLEYAHGQYPFVFFAREVVTSRLTDSRGVAELTMSQQQSLKLLTDSVEDHVQTTVNPPVLVPRGRPRYATAWEPFGQIPVDPRDRFEPVRTPQYPLAADRHREEILRQINEYHGRFTQTADPQLVQVRRQDRVDRFLSSLGDGLMQVIQLCQQFMTPEQLQRVTGGAGVMLAQSPEEIQGKYDLHLSFDVRDMDSEFLLKKARIAMEFIMPADRQATSRWDRFTARMWEALDPNWAEEMVMPPEEAGARETSDEQGKFVKMLAGVRPERPEKGDNFALRLKVFQDLMEERMGNEGAFPPLSAAARVLLKEHLDYLTFQTQQLENAQTGRQGFEDNDLGDPGVTGAGGVA